MAKESYKGATPETRRALEPCVKAIADAMDLEGPQYLHAILGGKESDPFARFKRLFRAVARRNPEGARGYIASLNTIMREASPQPHRAADVYELTAAFNDLMAVSARREDGEATEEMVEAAKHNCAEKLGRFGVRVQRGVEIAT